MSQIKTPKHHEFLLAKDDRLAYEPLEDPKKQKLCDKMMKMYITSTSKFNYFFILFVLHTHFSVL